MANNCVHCSNPNPEEWFYCRQCGEHASNEKYSKNMWMRTERGKRTDMEFRNITMDEHIKEVEESRNATG
tara:strand:+ start:811 stop:1020 length:210 start_codon:yes stop_codon:yes gene_type:complete